MAVPDDRLGAVGGSLSRRVKTLVAVGECPARRVGPPLAGAAVAVPQPGLRAVGRAPEIDAATRLSIAEAVRDGSPYVLFGHSLGALVAFEMAAARHVVGLPRPALVVVSGRNAPTTPPEWARRASVLTDAELFTELRTHGGIPGGLSRSIAAQFFLPRLRADLRMAAGCRADPVRHRIDAPLLVVHGKEDTLVHPRAAAAWAEFTDERCTVHTHSGGHFAIFRQLPEVVALIHSALLDADANAAKGV